MIRFWRLLCFLLGVTLFITTILRAAQPRETTELYQVIFGNKHTYLCCTAFMINEEKRTANQVRINVTEQPIIDNPFSPSGKWRFANVSTPQGYRSYFIPTATGEPMRLPDTVDNVEFSYWATNKDVLYYFQRNRAFELALFRITPQNQQPVQLTGYIFGGFRSIHEQNVPTGSFTPWVLLFWSMNVLVIAGGLKYSQMR